MRNLAKKNRRPSSIKLSHFSPPVSRNDHHFVFAKSSLSPSARLHNRRCWNPYLQILWHGWNFIKWQIENFWFARWGVYCSLMRSRDVKHPEGTCFATRGSDIVIFCIYLFVPVYNVFVCLCKLRRQHLVAACLAGQAGSVLGIFCTCFCIFVFVYYVFLYYLLLICADWEGG